MPGDLHIGAGAYDRVDFSEYSSISTNGLGSCIAVISSNGTISHLDPDWEGPEQVLKYIEWLKQNADPATDRIALIGGMDSPLTYRKFPTSRDMVDFIKARLTSEGFQVDYEDLYGMRRRSTVLDSDGICTTTDGMDPGYKVDYKFGVGRLNGEQASTELASRDRRTQVQEFSPDDLGTGTSPLNTPRTPPAPRGTAPILSDKNDITR